MEKLQAKTSNQTIVDSELIAADPLNTEGDKIFRHTYNIRPSHQRDDISDPYKSLSNLIKNLIMT